MGAWEGRAGGRSLGGWRGGEHEHQFFDEVKWQVWILDLIDAEPAVLLWIVSCMLQRLYTPGFY